MKWTQSLEADMHRDQTELPGTAVYQQTESGGVNLKSVTPTYRRCETEAECGA